MGNNVSRAYFPPRGKKTKLAAGAETTGLSDVASESFPRKGLTRSREEATNYCPSGSEGLPHLSEYSEITEGVLINWGGMQRDRLR